MRKAALLQVGGYSEAENVARVEDYDLWFRLFENGFYGQNLPETLYSMREDANALSRKRPFKYRLNEYALKKRIIKRFKLGLPYRVLALKPLILGVLPAFLYQTLHKRKQRAQQPDHGEKQH